VASKAVREAARLRVIGPGCMSSGIAGAIVVSTCGIRWGPPADDGAKNMPNILSIGRTALFGNTLISWANVGRSDPTSGIRSKVNFDCTRADTSACVPVSPVSANAFAQQRPSKISTMHCQTPWSNTSKLNFPVVESTTTPWHRDCNRCLYEANTCVSQG
jgi:hypothetical protein